MEHYFSGDPSSYSQQLRGIHQLFFLLNGELDEFARSVPAQDLYWLSREIAQLLEAIERRKQWRRNQLGLEAIETVR